MRVMGYPGGSNAGAYTGGNGGSGGAGDDSDTAKAGSDGSNGIGSRNENGSLYPAVPYMAEERSKA